MPQIKLSARLNAIARLVPPVGAVADVGTDHGYIPVWLTQNGHSGALFATDIKKEPLLHAKRTAEKQGFSERIEFRLCDGLAALKDDGIKTAIIAGMGGENIAEIISAAPWVKLSGCLLILQPMTKSAHLRAWLSDNGYKVLSEQLVEDGGIYEILTARAGKDESYSPAERLVGHANLISVSPLFERRLQDITVKTERAASGLSASSRGGDAERLNHTLELLASLKELKNGLNSPENKGGQNA
ncbi:MAG: class I SAM-dependent methyltransferase [Oscillospiraceae bacterium]|nr:class I SAM-dependent methyltransferase [Oscillospiraceae bacterium]